MRCYIIAPAKRPYRPEPVYLRADDDGRVRTYEIRMTSAGWRWFVDGGRDRPPKEEVRCHAIDASAKVGGDWWKMTPQDILERIEQ